MSDKITRPREPRGYNEGSKDQERTTISPRLQWVADLVCVILNAQDNKPSASLVKKVPDI